MKKQTYLIFCIFVSLFVACGKKKNGVSGGNKNLNNNLNRHENSFVQEFKERVNRKEFLGINPGDRYVFFDCHGQRSYNDWRSFSMNDRSNNCGYEERGMNSNGKIVHAQGNTESQIKNYLMRLLDRSDSVINQEGSSCFIEFKTIDGRVYIIDLRYPLAANPIHSRSTNGRDYILVNDGYSRPQSDRDCNDIKRNNSSNGGGQEQDYDFFFVN